MVPLYQEPSYDYEGISLFLHALFWNYNVALIWRFGVFCLDKILAYNCFNTVTGLAEKTALKINGLVQCIINYF